MEVRVGEGARVARGVGVAVGAGGTVTSRVTRTVAGAWIVGGVGVGSMPISRGSQALRKSAAARNTRNQMLGTRCFVRVMLASLIKLDLSSGTKESITCRCNKRVTNL
jgi:hypothetical protein